MARFLIKQRILPPSLDAAHTADEIRIAILAYLRSHRKWYARWSTINWIMWNTATFVIILSGAIAALLAASGNSDGWQHWALIALPALGSFLATCQAHFRFNDMCRALERGRIGTEQLICQAFLLSGSATEVLFSAVKLRQAVHDLETEQLNLNVLLQSDATQFRRQRHLEKRDKRPLIPRT